VSPGWKPGSHGCSQRTPSGCWQTGWNERVTTLETQAAALDSRQPHSLRNWAGFYLLELLNRAWLIGLFNDTRGQWAELQRLLQLKSRLAQSNQCSCWTSLRLPLARCIVRSNWESSSYKAFNP
jgi:hypothetical protein